MKDDIYYYREGVKKLINTLKGNEKIHIGIRPYGFHTGNDATLCVYPRIICHDFLRTKNEIPKFTFIISINDWEQDELDGPNYRDYPYNIHPKKTTIQYLNKGNISMVDFWQDVIEANIKFSLREFPDVKFEFYRNSDLINNSEFQRVLIQTLKYPLVQKKIYKKYSSKNVLSKPLSFAGVVCKECFSVETKSYSFKEDDSWLEFKCQFCNLKQAGRINEFNYWWYHKPLLIGRLAVYDIDVLLSGGDHLIENDHKIRKEMLRQFIPHKKVPKMIFAPMILSNIDGKKMSKSRNNTWYSDNEKLYDMLNINISDQILVDSSIRLNISDSDYRKMSIKRYHDWKYLK